MAKNQFCYHGYPRAAYLPQVLLHDFCKCSANNKAEATTQFTYLKDSHTTVVSAQLTTKLRKEEADLVQSEKNKTTIISFLQKVTEKRQRL